MKRVERVNVSDWYALSELDCVKSRPTVKSLLAENSLLLVNSQLVEKKSLWENDTLDVKLSLRENDLVGRGDGVGIR